VSRRLVSLVVSDPAASAGGCSGYVERRDGGEADRDWLSLGRYQVAIGGERYDATVSLQPPYDPAAARIRAW
jgi:hypothetical protein